MPTDKQLDRKFDSILRRNESGLSRKLIINFNKLSKDIEDAWINHGEAAANAVVQLNDIVLTEILKSAYEFGISSGSRFMRQQLEDQNKELEDELIAETQLSLLLWIEKEATATAKQINRTTHKIFIKVVQDVIEEQRKDSTDFEIKGIRDFLGSVLDKVKNVTKRMKVFNRNRVKTISTTESQRGIQEGQHKSAEIMQEEITKMWRTQGDSRVRNSHARVNGQEKKMEEFFLVGRGRGRFPQDSTLPIEESVNCRCYLRYKRA